MATVFSFLRDFVISGYLPIFGSSGRPFAPVPSHKEEKEHPPPFTSAPAPAPLYSKPQESSSNVVSSTMEDDIKDNIKVNNNHNFTEKILTYLNLIRNK